MNPIRSNRKQQVSVGTTFVLNLLLALSWTALTGDFQPESFLFGLILGYIVIRFVVRGQATQTYVERIWMGVGFMLFFIVELVKANIFMAYLVLDTAIRRTPPRLKPGIVAIPLDVERDISIVILANLITLTPGTLTLDVSNDKRTIFVHSVFVDKDNLDAFRDDIKQGFEKRIKDLLES